MKPIASSRSRCFFAAAVAIALAAVGARGQEAPGVTPAASPTAAPTPGPFAKPGWERLANSLALYSPSESPWAEIKLNHSLELHLFGLMRAEVRLWDLQSQLAAQEGNPARESAVEISRIVHEQILAEAAEALPLLLKTPNNPFAQLLVHQLEAYPYEWQEEGSEGLLPGLHKLIDPPPGKPAPEQTGGRHRRRGG